MVLPCVGVWLLYPLRPRKRPAGGLVVLPSHGSATSRVGRVRLGYAFLARGHSVAGCFGAVKETTYGKGRAKRLLHVVSVLRLHMGSLLAALVLRRRRAPND